MQWYYLTCALGWLVTWHLAFADLLRTRVLLRVCVRLFVFIWFYVALVLIWFMLGAILNPNAPV